MCSPAPTMVAIARCIAACPLAVAMAPTPPSSAAIPLLQHRGGRIGDPRVHVPGPLGVEQRRGVVRVRKTYDVVW